MLRVDDTFGFGVDDAISAPISGWRSHSLRSTPLKSLGDRVSRSRGRARGRPDKFVRGFLNCFVREFEARKTLAGDGSGDEDDLSKPDSRRSSSAFRLRPVIFGEPVGVSARLKVDVTNGSIRTDKSSKMLSEDLEDNEDFEEAV